MNHSSTKPALFNYIWLLEELVKRDLKIKYRRSVLGYVWSVLNPLLMMVVFTIVFSNLFKFDIPNYPLYLLCGQLIFNFFSDATTQAMNSILMGASLIKKVYLPKYIFPVARGLSSFVMMVFSLLALLIVMIVTGATFHLTLIMLPVAIFYLFLFVMGIGLVLSVLVIYFRDIEHLYGVFLTVFMYMTPIIYPISIVPDWIKDFILLNPLTSYVDFFRECVMYGHWPSIQLHLICLLCSLTSLLIGMVVFEKHQKDFILYI